MPLCTLLEKPPAISASALRDHHLVPKWPPPPP
jgi:hypothetical protein